MKNSFFRKTTSIALSFLMIASLIVANTTTALAETEVLYSCSFPGAVTYDNPDTTTRENAAGRGTMGTTYGWNSWESNTSLGTFRYDEETDRNYIALQDSYSGKGAFSISDSAITSGKIYMSFSYRKSGDASGNIFLRIIDGSDSKYHFAKIGSELGLCPNTNTAPSYTIGDFEGDNWHELGFVFDLDAGILTGYADGEVTMDSLTLPADMNGIAQLGIALNSTAYSGDITDFIVKRVTGNNTISAETRVDGYEITAKFNEPIGSPITTDDVTIEMCGTTETVSVIDVYYSGTTVKVTYDGELIGGREYRVNFGTSAKTLFGKNVPPAYFYIPAVASTTGLNGASDGSSVVNENGVIDFENLTSEPAASGTMYAPSKVTAPSDFYTYVGTSNNDKANSLVVPLVDIGVLNGNTSGNALQSKSGSWGLAFGEKLVQDDTRTVVYEFKYLYKKASTNAARINLALMNPNGVNGERGRIVEIPVDATAWHTMKVVYDRVTPKIDVYIDNDLLGSYTTCYNTTSKTTVNIPSYAWRIGADSMGAPTAEVEFYIDDFKQSYTTACAGVESVRYVDTKNDKSGLDIITSATKAIEIKFSEDMDVFSLEDIVLSGGDVTGTSYDSDTYTYTIELDNLLMPEESYTLVIPDTVTNFDGTAAVAETIYNFETGVGVFELSDLRMESYGEEVTDISAIAGEEVTLNVNMVNTLGIEGDIVLIYSLYENDALVDINYEVISLGSGMENFSTSVFTVREGINPDIGKVFIRKGSMSDFEAILPCVQY